MDQYFRLGYAMDKGLCAITEEDAKMLTHVNLAFGILKDGLLDLSWLPNIGYVEKIREYNPDIKIVLSIGGWGVGGFSNMSMTAEGRAAFCESVKEAVEKYNLDGIDMDWEDPCNGAAGIDYDPRDRENFTYLMQDLRAAIGPDKILSVATESGETYLTWTEMEKVAPLCDYVQIMTYDMRGHGKLTGHHSGLYRSMGDPNHINTSSSVEIMVGGGVPAEKIVIGAAFYCHAFEGVKSVETGAVQPCTGQPEKHYGSYGVLVENYIDKNGFKRYWDADAKAPYLYNGDVFLTYDDPESIRHKCDYVKTRGLKGIMYWAHGEGCHPLVETMYEHLK